MAEAIRLRSRMRLVGRGLGGWMGLCKLWFESGEDSLDVRRFAVHEAMSSLFSVSVWARSPDDDLDLEALIGRPAALTVLSHASLARPTGRRSWTGLCQQIEQVHTESTGLSTYHLRIVPRLWALSQRTNHRVFQHLTPREIVEKLLREWGIEAEWNVGQHAKLHVRTQYGESDYAFLSRILEEAGISFFFTDDEKEGTKLIFTDAPQAAEARVGGPIDFTDNPTPAQETGLGKLLDPLMGQTQEYVTGVRVQRQVRPGKVTLRDHDFRRKPEVPLLGQTAPAAKGGIESQIEVYAYVPGSFLVEMEEGAAKELDKAIGGAASGGAGRALSELGMAAAGAAAKVFGPGMSSGAEAVAGGGFHAGQIVATRPREGFGALAQAPLQGKLTFKASAEGGAAEDSAQDTGSGGGGAGAAGDAEKKKKSFGEKVLDGITDGIATGAGGYVAGQITNALFPGDKDKKPPGGLVGQIMKGAGGLADGQVTNLVKGKLAGALASQLGGRAAGMVGGFVGTLAGDLAGVMAQKLAALVASPLAPSGPKAAGDDRGAARFDEKQGQAKAQKQLDAMRVGASGIDFDTNAADLWPGVVFSIQGHPRKALGPDKRLLVTDFMIEGTTDSGWSMSAHAVFADMPYRPPMKTPKPQILGVQSALVVGPKGEEIHTDELGRVRVQFHWDREGGHDDASHCWIRVAQGSAGAGFGMIQLPRVGQEVLVGFLEGDPDHPMVMGSVFSNTTPVPHGLPGRKTRSSWRSNSYPGGGGTNEIMMEDSKGQELLYMLAEKDFQQIVKSDRAAVVAKQDTLSIGEHYHVGVDGSFDLQTKEGKSSAHFDMKADRIEISLDDAKVVLEKDTITLSAKKKIRIESEEGPIELFAKKGDVKIETKDGSVKIQGGPNVEINCPPEGEGQKSGKKKQTGGGASSAPSGGGAGTGANPGAGVGEAADMDTQTAPHVGSPAGVPGTAPTISWATETGPCEVEFSACDLNESFTPDEDVAQPGMPPYSLDGGEGGDVSPGSSSACYKDVCGAEFVSAYEACGADVCGAALCGTDICGAALCPTEACGGAVGIATACGAAACALDVAGAAYCSKDACGAAVCGLDACGIALTAIDACAVDACALDIVPFVPLI